MLTKMTGKLVLIIIGVLLTEVTQGALRRCYSCRSRGDRGSCKDPFKLNSTLAETEKGVEIIPCASGWCSKMLEGGSAFKTDDFDMATQRQCLSRGPSDSEERCANTEWNHKKVYMCFCQGDLCNGAMSFTPSPPTLLALFTFLYLAFRVHQ